MRREANQEIAGAYQIDKAHNYLRKAQQILKELNLINSKIDGSFFALMDFCQDQIQTIKTEISLYE